MEWIKVEEDLPKYSHDVLITDGKNVGIGSWDLDMWCGMHSHHMDYKITHWMKKPLPPKD